MIGRPFRVFAVLMLALVCRGGFPASEARGQDAGEIRAGDTVKVSSAEDAKFFSKQKVIARLKPGTTVSVTEVRGVWVGGFIEIEGETKAGWVHSRDVSLDDPAAVAALKKIEGLRLETGASGNVLKVEGEKSKITDADLAHLKGLPRLESLALGHTKIGDAGLAHIKGLKQITWLYLEHTPITDSGLAHLKDLTNLEVLALNGANIKGPGLVNLKGMKDLKVLNLSQCEIKDAALSHIQGLTKIETLALADTKINGDGLANVKGMTKLNVLNLDDCQLAKGTLLHLRKLKFLRILHLERAKWDKKDEETLDDELPSLAIFD